MAVIVTRETTQTDGTSPKGSPLTNAEVDTNFINLNDNKVEVSGAIIFQAKAGEALAKGDVVYVSGVSGNEPVVSKADANDASKMPAYGLAEDAASLNAAVNVVTFGTLYDLNTSSFAAGDTVYVSTTAGAITTTAPTGESSLLQNIGTVIRSHASAGSIKVGGAGRTNATPNLNDGNVFIGNASNQAEARALTGDDISGGTITSFASTGIDDNAASTAITIDSSQDVTFTSDAKFPDNGKAIFGAGSDLQIYHDGSNSYIRENGTGLLYIGATDKLLIQDSTLTNTSAKFDTNADVSLYYNNDKRLETTSTGIDVTGTVTSDGLTVDGDASISSANARLRLFETDTTDLNTQFQNQAGDFFIKTIPDDASTSTNRFAIDHSTGDISFYEDTGTTQAFFWDASTSRLGIGTTSFDTNVSLQVKKSGDDNYIGVEGDSSKVFLGVAASTNSLYSRDNLGGAKGLQIVQGSSATFVLDASGNVGIGETSPSYQLDVNSGADEEVARFKTTAGFADIFLQDTDTTAGQVRIRCDNNSLSFITNITVRQTIDSSGNVGIGTTPFAWSSYKNVGVAGSGALYGTSAGNTLTGLSHGCYYDGTNWKYAYTGVGSLRYEVVGSTSPYHAWYTAGSGTADANITFSERMRVNSTGSLILTGGGGTVTDTHGTASRTNLQLDGSSETIITFSQSGTTRGYLNATSNSFDLVAGTGSKLRLLSNGSGSTAVTLDTSGNLLVGETSSGSSRFVAKKTVATGVYAAKIIDANTTAANCFGINIDYSSATPNGSGNQFIYCEDSTALRMSVTSNGGISNYQAYDSNLSDQRAKKDIVESGDYLEKLCSIPVKNFRYNEDEENSKHHLGVIAQDVEAVAPEFVSKASWEYNEQQMDSVFNTDLMFAMMKSIQELSAQVNELKTEVAALKGA